MARYAEVIGHEMALAEDEIVTAVTFPVLAAGTYRFDLTGTGDADLYVRIGAELPEHGEGERLERMD